VRGKPAKISCKMARVRMRCERTTETVTEKTVSLVSVEPQEAGLTVSAGISIIMDKTNPIAAQVVPGNEYWLTFTAV